MLTTYRQSFKKWPVPLKSIYLSKAKKIKNGTGLMDDTKSSARSLKGPEMPIFILVIDEKSRLNEALL